MKISELKEGEFLIVYDLCQYGSIGKYKSHSIVEDEDDTIWCRVKFDMYVEFCPDCPTVIHDEYEYDFFCTEENGEYVTEDLETIVTTEEIVRSLFYNEDRFDKIHIFMNRKKHFVLVKVRRDNYCDVKVICDRKRHVVNDLFPRGDGCEFLSRLRMCSDEEKERLWKIVRTREVNR